MVTRPAFRVHAGLLSVVCALGVVLGGPAGPASGGSTSDKKRSVDAEVAELRRQLEGAADDLVEAVVRLRRLQIDLVEARAVLSAAAESRATAVRKDEETAGRLAFAEAQVTKTERDIAAQRDAEDRTRTALGRIARETYVGNDLSGLSIALQATTPEQFTERMTAAGAALRAQGGAMSRLAVVQAELRARRSKLDALRGQLSELKEASASVVAERTVAERTAAEAERRVSQLVTAEAGQVGTIRSKMAAERKRLATLEKEQAELKALLSGRAKTARQSAVRRRHSGAWMPPRSGGYLSYPVSGPATSGFGMRYHPILHYSRLHTGMDFGIACGTPVRAGADGDVVSSGRAGGYGNRVVIDHGVVGGGDLATTYNHLSSIVVSRGRVSRGQVIAYSGTTGLSTGCHLHFETLLDGRYVNPVSYL